MSKEPTKVFAVQFEVSGYELSHKDSDLMLEEMKTSRTIELFRAASEDVGDSHAGFFELSSWYVREVERFMPHMTPNRIYIRTLRKL